MKTANKPNASGILFSLSFIALFFTSIIFFLVADIDPETILQEKISSTINNEMHAKVSKMDISSKSAASNSMFYEFGN